MFDLETLCKNVKEASVSLLKLPQEKIDEVLIYASELLLKNAERLKSQNAIDIENAKKKGLSEAFIDRLTLSDKVIQGMASGLKQVAKLHSPKGETVYSYTNEAQGIDIKKINVPFGVVGVIYESRPNVTADVFGLCFKTGNAVILKGGSDSLISNKAVAGILRSALKEKGVNENCVCLIEDTSRETTLRFMKMNKYVDLLIPRGSASLIKSAVENSSIPIIETGTGNCHAYIDEFANLEKAVKIIFNAKTQRYSVCNALESIVIHSKVLNFLPDIANALLEKQVEIRADERAYAVIKDYPCLKMATEEDFYTEYGAPVISIKTVDDLTEAISHINEHSTKHSETIITENEDNAKLFLTEIDSSCVYHNASTRFSDGEIFGLGAEIGISTQKLHARGPMGLQALFTTKYIVKGNGSVRK